MRTWLRSKTGLLFMTCALLIAVPGVAWAADAVVSDGDVLTAPITDQDMSAGSVPCNSPTTKSANIALRHTGGTNNTFANGSTVTVTAQATGNAALSATMNSSTITLPSNWETIANNTLSPSVSSTVTINPTVTGPGTGTVTYTATGTEAVTGDALTRTDTMNVTWTAGSCDTTAPTTTPSATVPNGTGTSPYNSGDWTNKDVTLSLSATDTGGSLLKEIRYTTDGTDPTATTGTVYSGPITRTSTTTVKFRAFDNAGNAEGVKSFQINIDKVAPSVGTATAIKLNADNSSAGSYTAGDWTNKDVKVSWSCTDGGSGPVNASKDQTLTASGSVTPSCEDQAGNTASGSAFEVKIDKVAPTATFQGILAQTYPVANLPAQSTISCSAADTLPGSGPANCVVDFTGYRNAFGSHTLTATATDKAGNTGTATLTYIVGLQAGEVLSPINSTGKANPAATNLDSFKIKSTVPVKFQLFNDANKTQLMTSPPAGSVAKLTFFKQDNDTTTTDLTDTLTGLTPNTDNIFRWSATDSQYIYNLGTTGKSAGTYGVQLTLYASNGTTVLAQSAKNYFVLRT